jgi:hypothetical protein
MGHNPRAARGAPPFNGCDNTLLLAEAKGLGSADLRQIEIAGLALSDAIYSYRLPPTNGTVKKSPRTNGDASQTFDIVDRAATARERSCDFFTVP